MLKITRLAVALLLTFVLVHTQPAFAKSTHHGLPDHSSSSSSSSGSRKSPVRHSSTKKESSSTSHKQGNCDYPEQTDSAGRRCGNRAASVRAGGRLGGNR